MLLPRTAIWRTEPGFVAAGGLAIEAPYSPRSRAACGFLILNGCTAFETNTKIRTLSDSGFVARVPETPRQREAYAALPPYKLHRGVVKGNVFYAYKDEKNGVAYIGTEAEYHVTWRQHEGLSLLLK